MPERYSQTHQYNIDVGRDNGRNDTECPGEDIDQETAVFVMDRLPNIPTMTAFLNIHKCPPMILRQEDQSIR